MKTNRFLLWGAGAALLLLTGCLGNSLDVDNNGTVYEYAVNSQEPIRRDYSIEFYIPAKDTVIKLDSPSLPYNYLNEGEKNDRLELTVITKDNFKQQISAAILVDGLVRDNITLDGPNQQYTLEYRIQK
jgi:hypothetical protein